jgi:hypothetical protein
MTARTDDPRRASLEGVSGARRVCNAWAWPRPALRPPLIVVQPALHHGIERRERRVEVLAGDLLLRLCAVCVGVRTETGMPRGSSNETQ